MDENQSGLATNSRVRNGIPITLLCLSYFILQWFLIPRTMITADEFVFARHLLDYTRYIPYRDFLPYKSALGHYLLAIPLFFSQSPISSLFYIKYEIAFINTICLGIAVYWSSLFFNVRVVFLAALAILANQLSLFYMADLRVDMLATWFGLFSALSILQHRFRLSGILIGISFLISQKALWYFVAINGSLFICCFTLASFHWRHLFSFNAWAGIILAIYFIIWSCIASPSLVFTNLFYDAYLQAKITYYLPLYYHLWQNMLHQGPMLFLLWPLTLTPLLNKPLKETWLFSLSFAAITLILFINYKQPFPYNFVLATPALLLTYCVFLNWLTDKSNKKSFSLLFSSIYSISLFFFIYMLSLPFVNYVFCLVPIGMYFLINQPIYRKTLLFIFYFTFTTAGVIYPFYTTLKRIPEFNGEYQQTMIKLTEELTKDHSDYIAGVPFLFNQEQPVAGLKNLISPQISFLFEADDSLKPLLLPSIYLAPVDIQSVIQALEKSPIKVIITNYRILALPPAIIHYLNDHYQHYYGSLYLYNLNVHRHQHQFSLKFDATYRLEAKPKVIVRIDGKKYYANQVLSLKQGIHQSNANANYRLALIPQLSMKLDNRYEKDMWLHNL